MECLIQLTFKMLFRPIEWVTNVLERKSSLFPKLFLPMLLESFKEFQIHSTLSLIKQAQRSFNHSFLFPCCFYFCSCSTKCVNLAPHYDLIYDLIIWVNRGPETRKHGTYIAFERAETDRRQCLLPSTIQNTHK